MSFLPVSVEALIDEFARLPGIGRKSASRLAFHILSCDKEMVRHFSEIMLMARDKTTQCKRCCNLTDQEVCDLCASDMRNQKMLCVVSDPRDVLAIERCREYDGLYHVLHGVISPTKSKSPDDIKLSELLARINSENFQEVILATNPDTDGDTTALYIARLLREKDIKTSRLAYGLPMGSHVEHADETTIMRALDGRMPL